MAWWKALQQCLYVPSRIGLLLGLGAFPAAATQANAISTQAHAGTSEDLQIRVQGGELFFAEKGSEFQRLELVDSAESRALMRLLETKHAGSAGASAQAITLAGAGGSGFHWAPADSNKNRPNSDSVAPAQRTVAPTGAHPQRQRKPPKTTLGGGERTG